MENKRVIPDIVETRGFFRKEVKTLTREILLALQTKVFG